MQRTYSATKNGVDLEVRILKGLAAAGGNYVGISGFSIADSNKMSSKKCG
jgi:hypothetical protein